MTRISTPHTSDVPPPSLLKKDSMNLVWLDCEMTGLEPEPHLRKKTQHPGDRILEIAVILTNADLSIRVEGPVLVLHQSDELLNGMDAWNTGTHKKSGLTQRVRESSLTEEDAQTQMIAFISQYIGKGESPLCGNSIAQDRRFLRRYMPKLDEYFHYRNLDVSTLKELAKRWHPEAFKAFKKQQKHTALADVHESINELAHYRTHFLKLPATSQTSA